MNAFNASRGRVAAVTDDHLLVLRELPGRPLAKAIFESDEPCRAEDLIELLDAMPESVCRLDRRPPWSDAVGHYARMVTQALPSLEPKLDRLVDVISQGLAPIPPGNEPTHGDFHEGQVHVAAGRVCGLLDTDTLGPGRHRVVGQPPRPPAPRRCAGRCPARGRPALAGGGCRR